ncbi:MAG: hypothetical protein AAF485_15220, partial [Chloroflexota bacterium]
MKKQSGVLILALLTINSSIYAQPQHVAPDHLWSEQVSQSLFPLSIIQDHPDDIFWDDQFTLSGPAWGISSMVIDEEDNVYLGGYFMTAGGAITDLVARWNGTSWSGVGGGIMGPDAIVGNGGRGVKAMAIDSNGSLYAGGYDLSDGFRGDDFVVKLGEDSWSSIGKEWGSFAWHLVADNEGNLYAGGYVGLNQSSPHIAKWDGTSWSGLGEGLSNIPEALAVDVNGHVYASGNFEMPNDRAFTDIMKWDGTSWVPIGGTIKGTISALTFDTSGHLYVAGGFYEADGIEVSNIARWDGTSWSPMAGGVNGPVTALSINNLGELFVAGSFNMAGGINVNDGEFDMTGGVAVSDIAKWDGTTWSPLGLGLSGRGRPLEGQAAALATDSRGRLFAAGNFNRAGGQPANGFAMWDGTQWTVLGEPAGAGLNGGGGSMAIDENGDLYVGGGFTQAGNTPADNIARWDGTSWSSIQGWDHRVTALALGEDNQIYAAGFKFSFETTTDFRRIARWDGTTWSTLGEGISGYVAALLYDDNGNLYAGGRFDSVGVIPVNNIAKWDGTSWSSLGSGIGDSYDDEIRALALDANGNLFVGGEFDRAGSESVKSLAMWDGNSWSNVGGGLDDGVYRRGRVFALTFGPDDKLYVGGSFSQAGDINAIHNIASWDGVQWEELGEDYTFNTTVWSLATDENGDVYAGGQFDIFTTPFSD